MTPLPITVLTGFLGSGKTTLLSKLLRRPELADTAVVINEFGEVGLDHLLVAKASENIVEMSDGCLCCTVRGDLVETLADLVERREAGSIRPFRRVVIETTGLADPAPIIHTLMTDPALTAAYRLDGIVTVVDAVNGPATLDAHQEAVKQAAVADRLVVSKRDLPQADAGLEGRLRRLNPAAPIVDAAAAAEDPSLILNAGLFEPGRKHPDVAGWLRAEAYADDHHGHDHSHCDHEHGHCEHDHGHHHHGDANRHDDHIRAFCVTRDQPISGVGFTLLLQMLSANVGEKMLRVKGILNIAGKSERPAVIHGVQHIFHPVAWLDAWPDDDRRSRIVFITRDIPRDSIEKLLDVLDARGHEAERVSAAQ